MTPWTIAQQASLSMDFSRQKYWSGLPFPSPGDSSNPGFEPRSPAMQGMRVWSLGQEDPLEKEMATHSSIFAWEIPRTEEPGRLQAVGSQVRDE